MHDLAAAARLVRRLAPRHLGHRAGRDPGGAAVDAIPITREVPAEPPGTLAAPALVELRREHGQVAGRVLRRWHRGGATCRVASPAVIRGCAADRLTLQLGPTGAPSDWTTCAPTGAATALLLRRR